MVSPEVEPEGAGSIAISVGRVIEYPDGEARLYRYEATPAEGYIFDGWDIKYDENGTIKDGQGYANPLWTNNYSNAHRYGTLETEQGDFYIAVVKVKAFFRRTEPPPPPPLVPGTGLPLYDGSGSLMCDTGGNMLYDAWRHAPEE